MAELGKILYHIFPHTFSSKTQRASIPLKMFSIQKENDNLEAKNNFVQFHYSLDEKTNIFGCFSNDNLNNLFSTLSIILN
jgi:hypothetical protein